jgi:hypothetical protein
MHVNRVWGICLLVSVLALFHTSLDLSQKAYFQRFLVQRTTFVESPDSLVLCDKKEMQLALNERLV